MISMLACWIALSTTRQGGQLFVRKDLVTQPTDFAKLYLLENKDPLDSPKMSPKRFGAENIQWPFPWVVAGYSHVDGDKSNNDIRFRVFSQEQKGGKGVQVTQLLLRLWQLNAERFRLGHSPIFHNGIVDVYLCFGGKAGGEQFFGEDEGPDPNRPGKTQIYKNNSIYIYDMPSFADPVEMTREIAHEYGHATWPFIGAFKEPEEFGDGYLAEKIYLRWLRDALARNQLTPEDAMGATKEGLDKWLVTYADPLILKSAETLPTPQLLGDKSAAGMNAFVGLATYLETVFPDSLFFRTLKLSGSYDTKDYADGVILAVEEPDQVTLKIPPLLMRKAIWVPLGTGKLTGAPILKKDPSGWVQIQVGANPIVITNTH